MLVNNKNSIALKIYFLWMLLFSTMFIWYVELEEDHGNILTIAFLDIGQGDAIYIGAPNGNSIIVDGGPDRKLLNEIGKILPFYKRSLSAIVVTNPDADHYAGFINLLARFNVGALFEPGTKSNTITYRTFKASIKGKNISQILARRGMKIVLDTRYDIYLVILFPDVDVTNLKPNDGSIVMKLVYGKTSVDLQGDATSQVENKLAILDGENLKANILKAGHHGSRTSTTDTYVQLVNPEYAIISASLDNKYGHPHKETLATLNKYKIKILKTMDLGTITFHSNGLKLWRD